MIRPADLFGRSAIARIAFWRGTAFPYDTAPGYLIHDRDAIFNLEVVETAKILGTKPVRTAFKSPWQNGVAERFVGSCRRDLFSHVIVLNERHLKRIDFGDADV